MQDLEARPETLISLENRKPPVPDHAVVETDELKIPPSNTFGNPLDWLFSQPGFALPPRGKEARPGLDASQNLPTDLERLLVASIAKVQEEKRVGHIPVVAPAIARESLPDELVAHLRAPLPAGAIAPHPTKPYLSSIKSAFVIERLNEVFGPGGWQEHYEFVDSYRFSKCVKDPNGPPGSSREVTATMIVMKLYFSVPRYGIFIEAYGGNDNEDRGDAYKGACTDALTKAASHLGVALDIYKGMANQQAHQPRRGRRRDQSDPEVIDGPALPPKPNPKEVSASQEPNANEQPCTFVKPWSSRKQFVACMNAVREQVGEVEYLTVLNQHGKVRAEEFTTTEDAVQAYRELLALAHRRVSQ